MMASEPQQGYFLDGNVALQSMSSGSRHMVSRDRSGKGGTQSWLKKRSGLSIISLSVITFLVKRNALPDDMTFGTSLPGSHRMYHNVIYKRSDSAYGPFSDTNRDDIFSPEKIAIINVPVTDATVPQRDQSRD